MTPITRMLLVALVSSLLMVSFDTNAQQAQQIPTVGFLSGGSPGSPLNEAFEAGLRDLGWVKGQNVALEYRYAEGKPERLPDLAAELVHMHPDLIVVPGPSARVVRDATRWYGTPRVRSQSSSCWALILWPSAWLTASSGRVETSRGRWSTTRN